MEVRQRLMHALQGKKVSHPAYLVYKEFLPTKDVDWDYLFSLGLGEISHEPVVHITRPHAQIVESISRQDDMVRRDVTLRTEIGELHEYYIGGVGGVLDWRMEHMIKTPADYRILQRSFEDLDFQLDERAFLASENRLAQRGITLATADRTPFQRIQIDYAGVERFAYDFADEVPELFDLLEMMNEQIIQEFTVINTSQAEYVKLWENIGIDSLGPTAYREYIVPVYEQILRMFAKTNKKLIVHYDGKIRLIADDIKRMGFQIDSFSTPPEGDMSVEEARSLWPDTFLWIHPSLNWFDLPIATLKENIRSMVQATGGYNYCFEMSEGVPNTWKESVPAVLETLAELAADI